MTNFQIYSDMDGCLVDFEKGIIEQGNSLIRKHSQDFKTNLGESDFKSRYQYKLYSHLRKVYNQYNGFKDPFVFEDFLSREKGYRAFRDLMYWYVSTNKYWWINLDWAPDGQILWNGIKKHNPCVLSCPIGNAAIEGKTIWCNKNLGLTNDKIFIQKTKDKATDNVISILIDDREKHREEIESVGGIFVHHTFGQAEKTLEKLSEIINNI